MVRPAVVFVLALAACACAPVTTAGAAPSSVLRFFEQPGPPPPAGSPDPLVGQCVADVAGSEALGTQRCEQRDGLESVYDVELSPGGAHLYTAAPISDAVSIFGRDLRTGRLTPKGCISDAATEGCADGRALDGAIAVAASPDGKNVYVTTRVSDSVAVFSRNAATGMLIQLAGTSGCVSEGGLGGCGVARGLDHALGVEVSEDGRNVYVAGRGSDTVAVFARDSVTGALTQPAGEAGCLRDSLTSTSTVQGCAPAHGLDGAYSITLGPGDNSVYATARVSDAAAGFRRNGDGTLTQIAGSGGCIAYVALSGCAQAGRAFDGATDLATSPDGASAYVVSYGGDAVSVLTRDPSSGALSLAGCHSQDGTSPECAAARSLDYANAVEVSESGSDVYVSSGYASAVAVFARSGDGTLAQEPPAAGRSWSDGCLSWRGHKWAGATDLSQPDHSDHYCARSLALYYPYALELAPGGEHVYVASTESDTVTMLRRLDMRGYARPEGARSLRVPLAVAYKRCLPPGNRTHGGSLSFASCDPPSQQSDQLTVGTYDANGLAPQASGFARYRVETGDPDTIADESDVELSLSLSDVRRKADFSDYGGELQGRVTLRITDRQNSPPSSDGPGTVTDVPFSFTVPCAPTAEIAIGATCTLETSADSVVPGAAVEGRRTIWELGQIEVLDGGADDIASTTPNTAFARQGILVP